MKALFCGVGVGPGDDKFLTLEALACLKKSDAIFYPVKAEGERSVAFDIIKPYVGNRKAFPLVFPMKGNKMENEKRWTDNTNIIKAHLDKGKHLTFITIGNPLFYSTYTYILKRLSGYDIKTVAGITSFSSFSAKMNIVLAKEDEKVAIVPYLESEEELKDLFLKFSTVICLKAGRYRAHIYNFLNKKNDIDFYLGQELFSDKEFLSRDISVLKNKLPYLTVAILRRKNEK